jgi:predicted metal-dependent hydrolase
MIDLTVRIAVTADAEAIVRAHHESVWNTARQHYQPDVLEAWAVTLTDDSYEQVARKSPMQKWMFWLRNPIRALQVLG